MYVCARPPQNVKEEQDKAAQKAKERMERRRLREHPENGGVDDSDSSDSDSDSDIEEESKLE
jgi:hypothetical protein